MQLSVICEVKGKLKLTHKATNQFRSEYWVSQAQVLASDEADPARVTRDAAITSAFSNRKAQSVLEIGCGDGSLLRVLKGGNFRYLGIDLSFAGFDQHSDSTLQRNCSFARGDGNRLPLKNAAVDTIVMIGSLHHSGWAALSEAARVLSPGGVLVIADHAVLDNPAPKLIYELAQFVPGFIRSRSELRTYFLGGDVPETTLYSKSELARRLTEEGVKPVAWTRYTSGRTFLFQCLWLVSASAYSPLGNLLKSLVVRFEKRDQRLLAKTGFRTAIDFVVLAIKE